ncbi:MAG: hypothetical protein M5U30_19030 [Burkholderiaceae bacterium]|nr:hypothetical protein [Burkholderiaceae bacterium]
MRFSGSFTAAASIRSIQRAGRIGKVKDYLSGTIRFDEHPETQMSIDVLRSSALSTRSR